jgi:hypothetical protein
MRIRTLAVAGAAVAAGLAGGAVAWASSGQGEAEPTVRIVQQEQPSDDCPYGAAGGQENL